ncbi:aldo/keto reductase [Salinibacter altiplanensis]|uniref:aldo/keto reductase n=1 Tax=Salinibacter altiplanensis TaxID=1803181 RepID=UPI000C9F0A01|nr:aldo/keto reductase [Salinibacter altiplanensis]
MNTRTLGDQGLTVSALGLGCMGMSDFYGTPDENQAIKTLQRAIDRGLTFFDSADIYGPFTNERLLGRVLGIHHHEVTIATKFGIVRDKEGGMHGLNGRPSYVKTACEDSLQRLGVDTIDLYYLHRVDPEVPIEHTVGAMGRLVEEGKVRYLGLSETATDTLRRANEEHPITALQTEYSLWSRDPEDEILPTCRELGIGFVPYSPLGRGFLTGRFPSPDDLPENDWRRQNPRFQGENFQKNLDLVDEVKRLAADKDVTPAQLALAWVLHQGDDIAPIPGTTNPEHLDDNLGALDVSLSREELDRIDEIAPQDVAAGNRYPDMSTVNR